VFHVVLYQPEIPPNTGNIIRLCANAGCTLHLIEPLGFELDSAHVRRAGLDYGELAILRRHASIEDCLQPLAGARVYAIETGAGASYDAVQYQPGDVLLFGPETRGLPPSLLQTLPPGRRISIPMRGGNRSLNLSNAAAVVVYEAWRQCGFAGAADTGVRRAAGTDAALSIASESAIDAGS
jgi:tRNA (cytidine/uridine-2'-O-)-methyltransferase